MDALKTILQRAAIEKFHADHDQSTHGGGGGAQLKHGTNRAGIKARVARHPKGFIARAADPDGPGEIAGKSHRTRKGALASPEQRLLGERKREYDPYEDPDTPQYKERAKDEERGNKVVRITLENGKGRPKLAVGNKFKVRDGAGLASNKSGKIVPNSMAKLDGRGIPQLGMGHYRKPDWSKEVTVQYDDGKVDVIPRSFLG